MRNAVTVSAVFCLLTFAPLTQCQDPPADALFSPDQLDNLLAQVALYPDPLLAQVLVAATFPDQIDEAARFVRADSNPTDIDGQNWDVSVKAVAHYPTVLYMMADQLDWTTSLGQAYINQGDDVMASVQRLRAEAQAAGNLQTDSQMQVVDDGGDIEIWPEQPQYIFVPEYDPAVIYFQHGGFSWGPGFYIGAWLNYDVDWRSHRVVYHGWEGGKPWTARSLPYVRPSGTYVNARFRRVEVDHTVVNRNVNYHNLNRYETVHRDAGYSNVRAGSRAPGNPASNQPVNNKIIERNVNTNDPRINDYRGHALAPETKTQPAPAPQPRPEVSRQAPERTVAPPPARQERPAPSAFGGNQGGFNARESSQRGQESRQQAQRPQPAPRQEASRPAPAPRQDAPRSAPAGREEGGKKR